MVESPDVIWAKPDDADGKPGDFGHKPSPAALFFSGFLKSKGIRHGSLLDIGCGNGRDSVFFSKKGFDVHSMDIRSGPMEALARYGVKAHCASATEFWLFENGSFDFVIDVLCYCEEPDPDKRAFYKGELGRVLKQGGLFLISVPESFGKEKIEREFIMSGFEIAASQVSEDPGNKEKTIDLILSKKEK